MSAFGADRIQFDFELDGVRYRPTVKREPTEANLRRARRQMADIKRRNAEGRFTFAEEFPDYRLIKQVVGAPPAQRTCNQVFDEFLLECQSRVAKKDLAYVTGRGYRKLLAQIRRPAIGARLFGDVRYSELAKIVNAYEWTKKTYNNAVSVIRRAFEYGYKDHPEKHRLIFRQSEMQWRLDQTCPCSLSLSRARRTTRAKSCCVPWGPRILPVAWRVERYALKRLEKSGGEGGIARGRGRPLVLRFAPDRRG